MASQRVLNYIVYILKIVCRTNRFLQGRLKKDVSRSTLLIRPAYIKVSDLSHFLCLSLSPTPPDRPQQKNANMEFPVKRPRSQDEEELKTPTKKRRVPFVKAVEKDFQILIEHLARKREEERKKETNEFGEKLVSTRQSRRRKPSPVNDAG